MTWSTLPIESRKIAIFVAASAVVGIICVGAWYWYGISRGIVGAKAAVDYVVLFTSARLSEAVSGQKQQLEELIALVLAIEILVVGWRNSSVFRIFFARRRSAVADVVIVLTFLLGLTSILAAMMSLGLSLAAARGINWILSQYGWTRITLPTDGVLQLIAGFSIYWLASNFFQYWGHRLMHTPYLWHLHRFHHSATELNVISVFRQHPLEPAVISVLTVISPLILFKVSDQILLIYFLVGTTAVLLAHSQIPWTYGWIGRWIVISPWVHQVHHSSDDEHRDLHFSSCPLWDHLFGTWYKGTKSPVAFGIPDNQYEDRPLRQFVLDALFFYAVTLKSLRAIVVRPFRRPVADIPPALLGRQVNLTEQ